MPMTQIRKSISRSRRVDKGGIALDTEKLRRVREQRGMNQTQAAKAAGMTVAQWNDIESGRRANITLRTLDAISHALKVAASELLK